MGYASAVSLYERACHHRRRGWRGSAGILLRMALLRDPALWIARQALDRLRAGSAEPAGELRSVVIGTTGTCNASCVHCPTGKLETAHVPRGTMPMALFKRLIDGIAEQGLELRSHISFGLFGDGLVDPLVVARAEYLRKALPHARLCINTNGAAFNRAKHGALAKLADTVALHCESLTPETYDYLMQPLRFERVGPKLGEVLEVFRGKVHVSVPVSRRNLDEIADIRRWFLERGAREVAFDPLSSRCSEDQSLFRSLALRPQKIACGPEALGDLIVDCDGLVLACCNDFGRQEPIGDLAASSVAAVLGDLRREETRRRFESKRHDEMKTCSKCHADIRTKRFPFDLDLQSRRVGA